ncbi:MAG TPA: pyridoxamine 5'-phosphate oxidase family protein [Bradyrhizobium sp.]|nr:pyridoxamine 5'-phosphate oxidase family protein [Bradyrhizobium sp.]
MTSTAAMEAGSTSVERLLAAAVATMEKARYCWAMTVAEDGSVNARPMGRLLPNPEKNDWTIRFVTDGRSRKAGDIRRARKVGLIFQHDPDDAFIALTGRATLLQRDSEVRQLWKDAFDAYFPTAADRANAAFVEVDIERMELWIRGVTPEPFGLRPTKLERGEGGAWRSSDRNAA